VVRATAKCECYAITLLSANSRCKYTVIIANRVDLRVKYS
jgi:hypothetical protein